MMSSGEETEYFAPYGATTESKQQRLQKKQKRTRQRVDAGEPRNNYSSIPHFTSRPSFHSGGLYGSIFGGSGPTHQQQQQPQSQQHHQSQAQQQQQLQQPQAGAASSQGHLSTATTGPSTQQHSAHAAFGFFGAPGYGPAKMLNELLGRQVKQASDAGGSPPEGGHGMTGAGMDPAANLQSGAVVNCDDPATAELTQHMLRDILQGRKISALALQEQPNNNNSIHSNNNNTTADLLKSQQQHHQSPQQHQQQNSDSARSGTVQSGGEESGDGNNIVNNANHSDRDTVMPGDAEDSAEDAAAAARAMEEAFAEAGMEPGANLDGSDCEQSLPPSPTQPRSGSVSVKEEIQDSLNIKRSPSHSPCPIVPKTETSSPTTETKRARVENIVSTMRSSPALQTATVNGCKKRKLYQPQQQTVHHVLQHGVNDTMMDDEEESEEEEDPSTIRQKREEKDNLQTQLKKLHEQLAVMQQKYNELTSRIDSDASESIGAPLSPQPPLKPPQPHPPPYNGLPALPTEHPHAAAAAMYHMGQKLYLEQQQAALERMKQHQEATVRQQQQQHQQQQQQHQRQSSPPPPPSQAQQQSQSNTGPSTPQTPQMQPASTPLQHKEFQERINVFRSTAAAASSSGPHITDEDLQSLSDTLKAEITSYLTNLIDKVVTRFMQQRRYLGNQSEAAQVAAEQLNKDLLLASQILERKSPRTKVVDRGAPQPPGGPNGPRGPHNGGPPPPQSTGFPQIGSMGGGPHGPHSGPTENNLNQMNQLPSHVRSCGRMFQTPKPPTMYSMASMQAQQQQQQQQHQQQREHQQREQQQREKYCNLRGDERESRDSEQNEALSLVMTPKKKRHKVTDTRLTPRTVSRILAQEGGGSQGGSESPPPPPPPRSYHPPPPMLPVSLPTSVAIPNPSLHESQVFSPYSPFFNPHAGHPGQVPPPGPHHLPASPPGGGVDVRDSPPLPHPPSILHPALLAAAQHGSPDYGHLRMDSNDRPNDCNSDDISYDGIQPTSSMLTPIHLRKAKLMFFWVRYPSSSILKMYFPDIRFNKNNTAQLVKWFSNFREFYYIQMEKYARQAVSEGVKNVDDLRVGGDSEIYRVLNLHYNRNNHIEVPSNFRFVVEQTLKEFFKAIQGGKDTEQSWKKSIYKVISRLDDPVPEYFKTPNFLQQLG